MYVTPSLLCSSWAILSARCSICSAFWYSSCWMESIDRLMMVISWLSGDSSSDFLENHERKELATRKRKGVAPRLS
uniref:Putative secreted peptide n=1 Tax=Anopheles braziliensis TaxID=58242 RepID=A0A2M3ZW78_9DIPT